MTNPFDAIDVGQDFEDFAVGLRLVTVSRIDPDTGEATATVEDVPAEQLIRNRRASGGATEVASDTNRFFFRADRLDFTPKSRDRITDADGFVWVVTAADVQGFGALCVADVVILRA